jgi:hypothetical protein
VVDDWYYLYVLDRPIPARLIRDIGRMPIVNPVKINGYSTSPRRRFVPRARLGGVERVHEQHLRGLVKEK